MALLHSGHNLFGALFLVQGNNSLPKCVAWFGRFAGGQITDSGLRTSASGGNLGLCNPRGLEFGDDVFPVHAAMINGFPFIGQRLLDNDLS